MSNYDDSKGFSRDLTIRQRLAALRTETVTPLAVVHGFATLLARIILEDPSTFPNDYSEMVENILNTL